MTSDEEMESKHHIHAINESSYTNTKNTLFFLLLLLTEASPSAASNLTWPIKKMNIYNENADFFLGGFFPVHGRDSENICGRIEDEGLYLLEALLFTVKRINENKTLLPDISLGVVAVDSCDSASRALEVAMDFAKGFIIRNNNRNKRDRYFTCRDNSTVAYENGIFDKMVGIVGGYSSWVSIQLADLFKIYEMPQVSYQSTDPKLSDKMYEYFFRTVPPLKYQAKAIVEVLKYFQWTYVSVVYSDSPYGNNGFAALEKFAIEKSICFSSRQRIKVEISKKEDYDTVIKNLMSKNATAVVIFGDKMMARNLMSAATRQNLYNRFVWIASEAWGRRNSVTQGNEKVMEGTISITHDMNYYAEFDAYLKTLKPNAHVKHNYWFPEYWEEKFQCRYQGFDETPYNKNYSRKCSNEDELPSEEYMQKVPSAQSVKYAAHAIAHALHNMQLAKCGGHRICNAMKDVDGREMKRFLQNVTFLDNGYRFYFNETGDVTPRYTIVSFQKSIDEGYEWVPIGRFNEKNHYSLLSIDENKLKFKHNSTKYPLSSCSIPCKFGEAKVALDNGSCCWYCSPCTGYQYVDNGVRCQNCTKGTRPNSNKTACEDIPETFVHYRNPWAMGAIASSLFSMLITIIISAFIWSFRETPIVKSCGREFNGVLLLGIFASYSLTFAIVAKPCPATCGIVNFFLGLNYTLCYAIIIVKTRCIEYNFHKRMKKMAKKSRISTKTSYWVLTSALVSVEGIINLIWTLHDPPTTVHIYPTREENILICKGSDSSRYLVGLLYPLVLMGFCTVYAFKVRHCPDGFNEARYIIFTNCTSCIVWLIFLPMFALNSNHIIRTVMLSLLLNIGATVQLTCIFIPKLYIALLKPEKNTTDNVIGYNVRQVSSSNASA